MVNNRIFNTYSVCIAKSFSPMIFWYLSQITCPEIEMNLPGIETTIWENPNCVESNSVLGFIAFLFIIIDLTIDNYY